MAVNVKVGNFNQAIKHARLCMEMAKLNDWLSETIESDIHFALLCVHQGKYEEASEPLIEAESFRTHEMEMISLANVKYKLENNQGTVESLKSEYDVKAEVSKIFHHPHPPFLSH